VAKILILNASHLEYLAVGMPIVIVAPDSAAGVRNIGKEVRIGNNVRVGSHAFSGAGVIVGDGSIIGAGAVVLRDVEPCTVVGGVPARELRHLRC
jgi:acetyltransferase-like isoleucine patch superfamily enzyme